MTVFFTKSETETDRAHHLSDPENHLNEQKVPTDRDHETELKQVQRDNLEEEEEADPDLEFTSKTEVIGHVRAKGPVHHMHGREAKIEKAKTPHPKAKITKVKAKAKIGRPKTKIPKERHCKDQRT